MTAAQAGILLATWIFKDTEAFPEIIQLMHNKVFSAPHGNAGRQLDLLPLPFDVHQQQLVPVFRQLGEQGMLSTAKHVKRSEQRRQISLGTDAWAFRQQVALNLAWGES